jgi:hypothetical protein
MDNAIYSAAMPLFATDFCAGVVKFHAAKGFHPMADTVKR